MTVEYDSVDPSLKNHFANMIMQNPLRQSQHVASSDANRPAVLGNKNLSKEIADLRKKYGSHSQLDNFKSVPRKNRNYTLRQSHNVIGAARSRLNNADLGMV